MKIIGDIGSIFKTAAQDHDEAIVRESLPFETRRVCGTGKASRNAFESQGLKTQETLSM